mgnify:CR=1 FL=1
MSVDESVRVSGDPACSDVKIESVKVQIEEQKNTLHSILNVQKVFGFDIS